MPRSSTSDRRRAPLRIALVIAALTGLLLAYVIPYARAKPLWHDEIYTVLLARLPSVADTWRASIDGADLSPPLNLWITRSVHAVTGEGPVATRMPAMLGFYVAMLAVFAVLQRRAGTATAVAGALVPFFTAGLRYAAEARGYGLMMGLSAVVLYSWMEAAQGRRRRLHVPLLAGALAASLWNQYFGVLVFAPVVAGELWRVIRRRRVDLAIACAVALAVVAALPLTPLIEAAARQRSTFWSRAGGAAQIVDTYAVLVAPMLDPVFLAAGALVVLLIVAALLARRRWPAEPRRVPGHEAAALLVALSIPVLGFLLGRFVTGALVPRYVLSAIPAISIALPLGIWRAGTRQVPVEVAACAVLVLFAVAGAVRTDRPRFSDPVTTRPMLLQSLRMPSPTVVSSSLQFLQLWYYTPAELKGRMFYLTDPEEALSRSGSDTIDRGYEALSRWTVVPVEPYERFVERYTSFRVFEAGSGWLLQKLVESGAEIEPISSEPAGRLYQVRLRGPDTR